MKPLLRLCMPLFVAALMYPSSAAGSPQAADSYVIGAKDVLVISVFGQEGLGGRFVVEADGTITFTHLGLLKAGGLSVRQFEDVLRKRLGETLLRNPQVSVGVETYRSKRIFLMGEVGTQGQQPLTGAMTLIEALAAAGGPTASASGDVVIVRPRQGLSSAPLLPGQDATAEVIAADLVKLQAGDMTQNRLLQDGDTVYIPRAETFYVFGEVGSPGAYPIRRQMTVMQALSMAGGQTKNAALNRIEIIRVENGKTIKIKVKNLMTDIVKAGDTLKVSERWF